MAIPVILPRQGQSVESCIISKWHKQKGDKVAVGDLLFTYETDKSTFDEEAKVDGTFLGAFFEQGDDVECLLNVCVIGNEGEDIAQFNPSQDASKEKASTEQKVNSAPAASTAAPIATTKSGEGVFASPRAKAAAAKMGVDYKAAIATGPNGRIIERDVMSIEPSWKAGAQDAAAPAAAISACVTQKAAYVDEPLSPIRKAIAKNMQASLQNMAQLTHHLTFDATCIMNLRKQLKANGEAMGMPNVTLNDIIIYAVSRTLKNHKSLNAHYLDDKKVMRLFSDVNVGMAVDTERGLLVPTIFGADKMSLTEISQKAKEVAKAAQSGSIAPDLLSGATFTISNLGSLDIEIFTPVINPPQTGILGVNTIFERVKTVNGEIKTYPAMGLSLTYDHRALDGAPASRFLKDLKTNLENFTLLLMK